MYINKQTDMCPAPAQLQHTRYAYVFQHIEHVCIYICTSTY